LKRLRYESHVNLEDLCEKISSGGTPNRAKEDEYFNGDVSWVKTKELNDWLINDTEEKITQEGLKKSSAKLYPPKTILLAMYGVTVGKIGIIQKEMACNQACCALIVNENKVEHWFLFYYLIALRNRLIALSVGSAQPNISSGIIKKLKIPNLAIGVQTKYSRKLRQLDETNSIVKTKINDSRLLLNSLLNKVF
jgi:type I restriction enzyme S subunit